MAEGDAMDAARIIPTPRPPWVEEGATDAPDHHPSTRRHGGRGRPGRAGPSPSAASRGRRDAMDVTGSPLAAAAAEGWDAPGSAHRHPRRGGRGRGAVPDHPPRRHP